MKIYNVLREARRYEESTSRYIIHISTYHTQYFKVLFVCKLICSKLILLNYIKRIIFSWQVDNKTPINATFHFNLQNSVVRLTTLDNVEVTTNRHYSIYELIYSEPLLIFSSSHCNIKLTLLSSQFLSDKDWVHFQHIDVFHDTW